MTTLQSQEDLCPRFTERQLVNYMIQSLVYSVENLQPHIFILITRKESTLFKHWTQEVKSVRNHKGINRKENKL